MNFPKTCCIITVALTALLCESTLASETPHSIEVFTDLTFQLTTSADNTTVYRIDRIDQFQSTLSQQLPTNPETAKQAVIQRLSVMDIGFSSGLENAAKGLVLALHYGINRYPAIVFDSQAVVYGVTDIKAAILLYRQWQAETKQS